MITAVTIIIVGPVRDDGVECLALGRGGVEVHQRLVQTAGLHCHLSRAIVLVSGIAVEGLGSKQGDPPGMSKGTPL